MDVFKSGMPQVSIFIFHPVNLYPGLAGGVGGVNVPPTVHDDGPDIVEPLSYHAKPTSVA